MRHETILFIIDRAENRILLAMKKVRFGAGKYNGMGGRVEEGETPLEAAIRETMEEVGVAVAAQTTRACGSIHFSFEGKPDWERMVDLFVTDHWDGVPTESEEMAPEWFPLDEIPYDRMWIDDKYWLPLILDGHSINAEFHFEEDGSGILRQRVDIVG